MDGGGSCWVLLDDQMVPGPDLNTFCNSLFLNV